MSDSANSVILNFDKKRSVPNEIQSEVEVSVVKMIVITRDDCIIKAANASYKINKYDVGCDSNICSSAPPTSFKARYVI